MKKYITKRVMFYIAIVLVCMFIFFAISRFYPGDPISIILGNE